MLKVMQNIIASAGDFVDAIFGWDLANATFLSAPSKNSTVGAFGYAWSADGDYLYFTNNAVQAIARFPCSTAFDVSTASGAYDQGYFASSQCSNLQDVAFNAAGTKMYALDHATSSVYQYTLSTAWSISSASYDSVSLTLSGNNFGMTFNDDGTELYEAGSSAVRQYTLSTAYDLSTATYTRTFSTSTYETNVRDVHFKSDGTKMYTVGRDTGDTDEYTLSTAWDISSASHSSTEQTSVSNLRGFGFNDDGTVQYALAGGILYQYEPNTAWANEILDNVFNSSAQISDTRALAFSADGTKMYAAGFAGGDVYQYTLSEAFNINTASYASLTYDAATELSDIRGISWKPDGTKFYIHDIDDIYQYSCSTAWNVSTASYDSKSWLNPDYHNLYDVFISPDGTRAAWVNDNFGYLIESGTMSTAWDISTMTRDSNSFDISSYETTPTVFYAKSDGTRMYFSGQSSDEVFQVDLSTAWDLSTASYNSVSYDVSGLTDWIGAFVLDDTGTFWYLANTSDGKIHQGIL